MRSGFKLIAACLALAAGLLCTVSAVAQTQPQRNIVFVMVDDLDVSVFETALNLRTGGTTGPYILPNIRNRLIKLGTKFDQMFASQPLCCPSRATFQTGQYPHNHGVVSNKDGDENDLDTSYYLTYKATRESTALGTWMQSAGYRTGHFGKYMNGSGWEGRPPAEPKYHVPAGWDTWRALVPENRSRDPGEKMTPVQCMYGYTLSNNDQPSETFGQAEGDYQTDKLAELAEGFILNPDPRPFLLVVTPTAPHTEGCTVDTHRVRTAPRYLPPYPVTPQVELPAAASYNELDVVRDKPKWVQHEPYDETGALLPQRRTLYNDKIAALRPIDDMIGRLLEKLQEVGKLNNTIVIFTSDNGYQYGTHRLDGKEDFYEESARIPMIVKVPGQSEARTSQAWVLNNDWAATLADYAGIQPYASMDEPRRQADGRSFRALAESALATSTRETILIRTGANPIVGLTIPKTSHYPYLAVRTRNKVLTGDGTGTTVLIYAETYNWDGTTQAVELYDLKTDAPQMQSLHTSKDPVRIAQKNRLKERLDLMKTCNGTGSGPTSCQWLEDN